MENPPSMTNASRTWSPVYATSEPATTGMLDSSITEGERSFLSGENEVLKQSSASSNYTGSTVSSNRGPLSSDDMLQHSAGESIQQGFISHGSRTGAHSDQVPARRMIGSLPKSNVYNSGLIPAIIEETEAESRTVSRTSLDKTTGPVDDDQRHPLPVVTNIPHLIKGATSITDLPPNDQATNVLNVKKARSTTDIAVRDGRRSSKSGAVSSGRIKLKPIQPALHSRAAFRGGGGGGGGGEKVTSKGYFKAVSAGELGGEKTEGYDEKRRASESFNRGGGGGGGGEGGGGPATGARKWVIIYIYKYFFF